MDKRDHSARGTTRVRLTAVAAFGAAALIAGLRPDSALAVDGVVHNPANGHWYLYVSTPSGSDWASCDSAATGAGGYLATIESVEENDWIVANLGLANGKSVWIGGTDSGSEGNWSWSDGEPWSFTNWAPGEPSDTVGAENWLAIAPDGTWSDESASQTLSGYVVEWNTDPNATTPTTPPSAPTNLVAVYSQGLGVSLTWNDTSADEAGFVVERMPEGLDFSVRRTTDVDVETWTDFALFPSKTYTYRVAAINDAGMSAFSSEVSITTSAGEAIPAPPAAPSGLAASVTGPSTVDLTWSDNSGDETLFDLERAVGGAGFGKLPSRPADSVAYTDGSVHPGWPYVYRVRALGLQGPSAFSNSAAVTVPPTIALSMTSGAMTRATKPGRDTIRVGASLATVGESGTVTLDPIANGVDLQVGPPSAPVTVSIPAHDAGWKTKLKKGEVVKATWKSKKGVSPKVTVTLDLVHGTVVVSAASANFAQDTSANLRFLFACGEQCGAATATWTPRRAGSFRLE